MYESLHDKYCGEQGTFCKAPFLPFMIQKYTISFMRFFYFRVIVAAQLYPSEDKPHLRIIFRPRPKLLSLGSSKLMLRVGFSRRQWPVIPRLL